ncbi:TPA: hypothetical protein MIO27_26675 [Klebsiella pneumoniae subsp. pneumoniae]|nr:hypothetical protein EJB54_25205 [Klebsiella pneumoniae]HBY0413642.1 hypothetical protein [Klebsiella pneumoniae subsp. pneumoniae]
MVLHAFPRLVIPVRSLSRRGLSLSMHLHENRPTKRAGVAGRALRAKNSQASKLRSLRECC